MGILFNVKKTRTPTMTKDGFRTVHHTTTKVEITLTTLGKILLFPVWFPLTVLFVLVVGFLQCLARLALWWRAKIVR